MASHNPKHHTNNILNLSLAAKSTAALLLTICDPLTEFALVPEICLESSSSANGNNADQTQQQNNNNNNNNNSDVPLSANEQQQQSVLLPFKIHEALSYSRYGINSQRVPDASASHYAWNFLLKYAATFGDRSVVVGKNRKQKDSKNNNNNNNNDENENILMKELENFLLMNTADEDIHIYELFGLAVVGTNEKENVVKNTTSAAASKTQPQQPQRREREETAEKNKDKQQPAATMASLPPLNDNQRKLALVIQQLALATACILLGYKSRGTLHHIYPIARALFPRVIKIIVSLFPCPPNNNNSQTQQQSQEPNSNSSPASSKKKVSFNFEASNDVDGDNEDESQKVKENPEKDLASLFLSSTTPITNGNSNSERKPSSKHKSSSSSQQQQLPHQLAIARYYDRCIIVYEIILMQLFSSQSCQLTPTPFAMIRSSLVELVVGFTRLSHYPPRMIQNPLARQFGLVSYVFRTHDELPFTMVRLVDSRAIVEEKKKKIDQEFEIANQRNESYYLSILKKKKKKKAMMMNNVDVDFNEDDYDDDEDESNNDAIANNNVGIGLMSLLPSLHDDVPLAATSSSTTVKSQINNLPSISLLDKLPNLTDDDANVMVANNNSNVDVLALLPSLSSQDNNNHSTSAAGGFRMVPVWKQTQNQSNGDPNNTTTTTLSQNNERNNNNNIPPLQQDIQVSSGSLIPVASSQPPISFGTAPLQQQQLPALIVNDNNKEGGGDDDDDDWFENDLNNPTSIKSCAPLASLVEQLAMKNNNILTTIPPTASLAQQQLLLPQHAGIVTLTMPDIQKGGMNNNNNNNNSQQSQIVPPPSAEIWWSGAENNNNNNINSQGRTSTSFFVDSTADQQADLLFLKPEEKQQRQALLMEEKRKKEVCGAINVQKMLRSVSSLYDLPTRSGTAPTTINPATANASGNNNNFEEAQQTLERWSKKAMRLLSPWGDLVRRVSARDYYEFMHQQQQQPQQQQNEDSAQNNNLNNIVKPKLQYFNQFPTFQANTQMMDLLKISNEKVHSWLDRWSGAAGCRKNKNESSSSSSSLEFFSVPFSAVITRLALLASIVADFAVEKKCDIISPLFPQVDNENRYSLSIDSAIQQTENNDDNKQLLSYLDDSLFSQISSVSSSYQVIFEALTYFSGNHPPEIAKVSADQQHNKNNIKRNNIINSSNLSDQRQQTREMEILKAYFNISDAVELRRYILHLARELILAEKSDIEAEREKVRAVEEKRQQMSYHYFDDLMGFGSNIDNNGIAVSSHNNNNNNNNANYFYDATSSMETTMRMHQQPMQDGHDEMNNSFNQNSNVEQNLYGEALGTGGQVNFLTQEQVFGSL